MAITIPPQTALATLTPLSVLAASYDGLLCDIWGVLHNGVAAFDDAVDALCRYRAQGGIVILITNAPGPISKSIRNWNVLVSPVRHSMRLSHNDLTIGHDAKAIPYSAGARHGNSRQNYGFMNLNANPEAMLEVAKLKGDNALMHLVKVINSPETGLMTIGCSSGFITEASGSRKTGYVEISFTTDQMVKDAQNYFPLFYHFSRALREASFDAHMHFSWELMPAHFVESDVDGFTIAIHLNTGFCDTSHAAADVWAVSTDVLASFLKAVPPMDGTPLF